MDKSKHTMDVPLLKKKWMKYPKHTLVSLVETHGSYEDMKKAKKESLVEFLIQHNQAFPQGEESCTTPITQRCKSDLLRLCRDIDPHFDAKENRKNMLEFLKQSGKIHSRKSSKQSQIKDNDGTTSPINIAEYINNPEDNTVLQEMIVKLLSSNEVHFDPSVEKTMSNVFV